MNTKVAALSLSLTVVALTLAVTGAVAPPPRHHYLRPPPPPPQEESVVQRVARWFFPPSSSFFGGGGGGKDRPTEVYGAPPPPSPTKRQPKYPAPPFHGGPTPPRYGPPPPLKVAESKPPPQLQRRPWRRPPATIHYGSPKPPGGGGGHLYIPHGPIKQHGPPPPPPPKKKDCNPCNKVPWIPVAAPGPVYGPPEATDHGAYNAAAQLDQKPAPDETYGPPPIPPLIEIPQQRPQWPSPQPTDFLAPPPDTSQGQHLPPPHGSHVQNVPPPPPQILDVPHNQNFPPQTLDNSHHVNVPPPPEASVDVVPSVQVADFVSSVESPVEVVQAPPYLDAAPPHGDQSQSGSAPSPPQFSTTFNLHDNFSFPLPGDDRGQLQVDLEADPLEPTTDHGPHYGPPESPQQHGLGYEDQSSSLQQLEQDHYRLNDDHQISLEQDQTQHSFQQDQVLHQQGFNQVQTQNSQHNPQSNVGQVDLNLQQHDHRFQQQSLDHAQREISQQHQESNLNLQQHDQRLQQQSFDHAQRETSHQNLNLHQHGQQSFDEAQRENALQNQNFNLGQVNLNFRQQDQRLQQQSSGQIQGQDQLHPQQQQQFGHALQQDSGLQNQQSFHSQSHLGVVPQDPRVHQQDQSHIGQVDQNVYQQRENLDHQQDLGFPSAPEGQRVIVDIQPSVQTAANGGSSLIYQINGLGAPPRPTGAAFPPTQTSVLVSFQHGPQPSPAAAPLPPPRSPLDAFQSIYKPDLPPSQFLSPPGFNAPPLWIPPISTVPPPPPPDNNAVASLALPGLVPPPAPSPPKKTKQIQIIVPYTSSKELIRFDGGWRPMLNCSVARLGCGGGGGGGEDVQESRTVTATAVAADSGAALQRLQKNIDAWTAQQFSRHEPPQAPPPHSAAATTLKHLLLAPSKKIPEEYLRTTPLPQPPPPPTTPPPTLSPEDDHEAAGSHRHSSWEFVEANLVLPEEVTLPPPTTEDTAAPTTTPEEATTPPWEVSISPITKEKVYVVTPLATWHEEEALEAATEAYRLPKAEAAPRFLVRPTPAPAPAALPINKLFREHFLDDAAEETGTTTTTPAPSTVTSSTPALSRAGAALLRLLNLSTYSPPEGAKVHTYAGHSKVTSSLTTTPTPHKEEEDEEEVVRFSNGRRFPQFHHEEEQSL